MTISPKRQKQIDEANWGLNWFDTVKRLYTNDNPGMMNTADFLAWLSTDPTPTPAPLTVAELDEADRLGMVLLSTIPARAPYIDMIYLTERDEHEATRSSWNAKAAAVIAEYRAIQRERGDVIVPGDRDEDADAAIYGFAFNGGTHGFDKNVASEARKRGIDAFLAHHAGQEVSHG